MIVTDTSVFSASFLPFIIKLKVGTKETGALSGGIDLLSLEKEDFPVRHYSASIDHGKKSESTHILTSQCSYSFIGIQLMKKGFFYVKSEGPVSYELLYLNIFCF